MYTWFYDHFINTILFPLTCIVMAAITLSAYAYVKLRKTKDQ
ncbi:hypothetical protein BMEGG_05823 [Priestia megaterium]